MQGPSYVSIIYPFLFVYFLAVIFIIRHVFAAQFTLFLRKLLRFTLFPFRCLFKLHRLVDYNLRIRNTDMVLIKEQLHLTVQITFHLPSATLRTENHNANHHTVVAKRYHAFVEWSFQDTRNTLTHMRELVLKNTFHTFQGFAVLDPHVNPGVRIVSCHIDNARYVTVADNLDIFASILDFGSPDPDLYNRSPVISDSNNITNLKLSFKDDKQSGQNIRYQCLCAKSYDQCQDSG